MNTHQQVIREPVVAGTFYPADAKTLEDMVNRYLSEAVDKVVNKAPKAIISPHAGYIYSGSIAASVFINIKRYRERYKKVVILGPSHRIGFKGVAYCKATQFKTPLGNIPVDLATLIKLEQEKLIMCLDQAHIHEHSLEVQLPFLQETLGEFELLPLVVGDASTEEISTVVESLWGNDETLIVISSDLSHYLSYDKAREMDQKTSERILNLEYSKLQYGDACGRNPIKGLLKSAEDHHLHASLVDLRNSGDTAGDKVRVVGYGAYVFN
jgi:AmmeMemoRadiSam system protein B